MGNHSERGDRLEIVLKEEIESILRCEARDPRLSTVDVTRVELSPGGARARVWFKTREDKAQVLDALDRARGFIRTRVAEAMGSRRTPELVFRWDPVSGGEVL